ALPTLEPQRPEVGTPYVAPSTPAEHTLTAAWRQLLRVKRVGMDDSFFSLGGNSLQLVQLLGFMGTAFTKQISIAELFQYPTGRSLAAYPDQPVQPSRVAAAPAAARPQHPPLKSAAPLVAMTLLFPFFA